MLAEDHCDLPPSRGRQRQTDFHSGAHTYREWHLPCWSRADIADSTNAYPSGIALAASFDADLLYRLGEQMSQEALAKRVHVVLGPTVNIVRSPLAGRGFEFFSEDPHLSGRLASQYVNGIQDNGVAACMKHFVGSPL